MTDLIPFLYNFLFSLVDIRLLHDTPDASHFNQPALILFVTSSTISPLICTIDPRWHT